MALVIIDKFSCFEYRLSCSIMRLRKTNPVCYTDCAVRCDGQVSQIAVGRIALYLIVSYG